MTDRLLWDELLRDEGLKLTAYRDSVGLWTIGVGHFLGESARMTAITEDEAHALFAMDIETATARASILVPALSVGAVWVAGVAVPMEGPRKRAVINMAFNLGNRLFGFKKFLAAVNAGDWEKAGQEMLDSKWATQVGARATRLRDMIVTGKVA